MGIKICEYFKKNMNVTICLKKTRPYDLFPECGGNSKRCCFGKQYKQQELFLELRN